VPLCGEHEIGEIELIRVRNVLDEICRDEATDAMDVDDTLMKMVRDVIDAVRASPHSNPALPLAQLVLGIHEPSKLPDIISHPGPVTEFLGIDGDGTDGTTETPENAATDAK
jgi:hypothetical protein